MTIDEKRIKILEYLGWTEVKRKGGCLRGIDPDGVKDRIPPNHFTNLNAMYELEQLGTGNFVIEYERELIEVMIHDPEQPTARLPFLWMATAEQRAEAFAKTLELW